MRRPVRYNVAASLDGFLADADGAFDWIPDDPTIDFGALFARIDTVLLGRRTFELVHAQASAGTSEAPWSPDTRVFVFSDTLAPEAYPDVSIVRRHAANDTVAALRAEPGAGEIWLFGGGELFAGLLSAGLVDRVEVTVVPILLGRGVPLLPATTAAVPTRARLALRSSHVYPSGMVALTYDVRRSSSDA
jgi:dihydrofolate reductase